jgi:hypothetical protein
MRTLAKVVVGCVVLGSAGVANQGCGCGPIMGAYFTPAVVRYTPQGWVDQPSLLRPRTFATAIPLDDGEHYLVAGGYIAEHDGDPADDAHTIELCSVTTDCISLIETEDLNQAEVEVPRPGAAYLPDGTVITPSLLVKPIGTGGYAMRPAGYGAIVQLGDAVVAQARDTLYMVVDYASPPRAVGVFTGHTLATAIDADHVLLVSAENTMIVDLTTGGFALGPGPGAGARVDYPVGLHGDALVLGATGAVRYVATSNTWRSIPALAEERWTIELPIQNGAILSAGDPDPENGRPYHLVLYDATTDSVTPLPVTPPFDLGATWMELPSGEILRIGGARTWFDTVAGLAAG